MGFLSLLAASKLQENICFKVLGGQTEAVERYFELMVKISRNASV